MVQLSARRSLVDLRPLRASTAYRRIWLGTSLGAFGQQITTVAVLFQVWQLTGNPLWTGVIGLVHAVPLIVFGLVGGALADSVDRRALVRLTTAGQVLAALGLAAQALADVGSLPLLFALVALQAACGALGAPARRTLVPRLLPGALVPAGIALQHLSYQLAMLVGPTLAGGLIAWWGLAACYLIDAAMFSVSFWAVWRLPPLPAPPGGGRASLRSMVEGWRFVGRRRVLRGTFATDVVAMVMAMPVALFPLVNEERFGGDPRTLGFFFSAIAVGGITTGLLSGAVTRADRLGLVQFVAAGTWGVAIAGFGLAGGVWPALAALAVAGAADSVSVISRGALVQLATPDSHRGRVSSVEHVVGIAGPDLGNLRAGVVGALTSAPFAVASGGIVCAVWVAALAVANGPLRGFRQRDHVGA